MKNSPQPSRAEELSGVLIVNKAKGFTSHDVVQIARRALGIRKIGHTGTLDPAAEGLLILLVGRATKHQEALQRHNKVYEARICLGTQTETGDADGAVVVEAPVPAIDGDVINKVLRDLEGERIQRVPAYSAVKIDGKPAYWWARQNKVVELPERTIHLSRLELMGFSDNTIDCRVHCTAGTYVRVLAETVAEALGTVGHLGGLVRTSIGKVTLEEAIETEWIKLADREAVAVHLKPIEYLE